MTVLTPPGYLQGGTYTAKLDRIYLATLGNIPDLASTFSARQGFLGGRVPTYANPSGMDITIGMCSAVIANTFASASGDYLMANDATVQVTLAASSPTQNRHDIIGFQVKDNLFDSSGLNTVVPAVIQGANSAGTPSDPALPASFIPVLRAVVNALDTSPSTLQSLIRKTTSDGGLLRVASVTERAEIAPHDGMQIYREDRGWVEVRDGGAWRIVNVAHCTSNADRDSAITDPYNGQLAVTTDTYTVWLRKGGAWVDYAAKGIIKYGRRTTSSTTATSSTPVGVERLDNINVIAGRAYVITVTCHPNSTVQTDNARVDFRASTSGVATTASAVMDDGQFFCLLGEEQTFSFIYIAPSTATLSVLLCVARDAGSGAVDLLANGTTRNTLLWVEEMNPVTDTGVDV